MASLTGRDDADGEAVVDGQRLVVHLHRQQNVAVGAHRHVDRDRGSIGLLKVAVQTLELSAGE